MRQIEKLISPLVQSHFPEFYKDEGARFIDFVKQYYVWMESSGQAVQASRNLLNTRDIDKTAPEFINLYKQKYLNGIPISSTANTQLLIKHAQDFYKSKGTSAGIELVIRSLFDKPATVYLPSSDLFKTSHGTWVKPIYLELSVSERTKQFVGREIVGNSSGAKAFLESLVRRRVGTKYLEVAYLSNLRGDFNTGEYITTTSNTEIKDAPKMIGSMTTLTTQVGGANFAVGDIFDVTSSNGKQGQARVTGISNQTGKVNFIYVDALTSGGWGYSIAHANVIVSTKVLTINNVNNANAVITQFSDSERVVQSLINVAYTTARGNNALFEPGAIVENFANDGSVNANGVIVATSKTNSTAGYMVIAPNIGNLLETDTTISIRAATTTTAAFNALTGVANSTEIITTVSPHGFSNNTLIRYQVLTGNTAITGLSSGAAYYVVNAASSTLQLSNTLGGAAVGLTAGLSETGHQLVTTSGTAVATSNNDRTASGTVVGSNTGFIGVVDQSSNGFISTPYANLVGLTSNTTATIANTSTGSGAMFTISLLTDTENVFLSPDFVGKNNTQNVVFSTIGLGGFNSGNALAYGTNVAFNANSAVVGGTGAGTNNVITISSAADYAANTPVRYYVDSGNTAIGGLTNNTVYWTDQSNTTTISLKATKSGSRIALTQGATQSGHHLVGPLREMSTGDVAFNGFGFVKFPGSNIDSILLDCLRFDATTIGSIAAIAGLNPGSEYNTDPFVVVQDTYVSGYGKRDYKMSITPIQGAFIYGEQIQQTYSRPAVQLTVNTFSGTAANGTATSTIVLREFVYQSNTTTANTVVASGYVLEGSLTAGAGSIKLYDVTGTFANTTNANTKLKTISSGATANIQAASVTTYATTARAIVKEVANTTFLKLKRINLENTFQPGSIIVGRASGATATVVSVDQDSATIPVGLNAVIGANVQAANNVVTSLAVADSGFGYINKETVILTKQGSDYQVTATVSTEHQGRGLGFFSSTRGFLDSDKKLHDNDYYQEYSYDVRTKIPFDLYVDILKKLTHVAGTKAFGTVDASSTLDLNMTAINSIVIT